MPLHASSMFTNTKKYKNKNPFTFLSELKTYINLTNSKRNHAHYYWESEREQ